MTDDLNLGVHCHEKQSSSNKLPSMTVRKKQTPCVLWPSQLRIVDDGRWHCVATVCVQLWITAWQICL